MTEFWATIFEIASWPDVQAILLGFVALVVGANLLGERDENETGRMPESNNREPPKARRKLAGDIRLA